MAEKFNKIKLTIMFKIFFSSQPLYQENALAIMRIFTGFLIAYHGCEVFDRATMETFITWDTIKGLPAPEVMVYLGKGIEFVAGVCLIFGFFTRVASLLMAVDMLFICFKIGNGKFYYEDQHPFLFALLATIFFFTGPVKWGLDFLLFKKTTKN